MNLVDHLQILFTSNPEHERGKLQTRRTNRIIHLRLGRKHPRCHLFS